MIAAAQFSHNGQKVALPKFIEQTLIIVIDQVC